MSPTSSEQPQSDPLASGPNSLISLRAATTPSLALDLTSPPPLHLLGLLHLRPSLAGGPSSSRQPLTRLVDLPTHYHPHPCFATLSVDAAVVIIINTPLLAQSKGAPTPQGPNPRRPSPSAHLRPLTSTARVVGNKLRSLLLPLLRRPWLSFPPTGRWQMTPPSSSSSSTSPSPAIDVVELGLLPYLCS